MRIQPLGPIHHKGLGTLQVYNIQPLVITQAFGSDYYTVVLESLGTLKLLHDSHFLVLNRAQPKCPGNSMSINSPYCMSKSTRATSP